MPTLLCTRRRFLLLFWSAALVTKVNAWWPDYSCRALDCHSSSSAASHRKRCSGGATSSVHLPVSVACRAVPTDSDGDDVCRETLGAALGKMAAVTESGFASQFNQRRMNLVEVRQSSVPGAGLGLFAKKALKSGTVISFYPAHILGMEVGDRIRRISLDGITGQVEEQNGDVDDDAPPKVDDAYLHHILGKRPLMHADIAQDLGGAAMFLDVDMMRPESPGWDSHRINDGATVLINSEDGVLTYYRASRQAKNCVHVPFGPSPILATVTTKKVKKGEELFTTYGCSYWLAPLMEETGESSETEMTDNIISEAKEVAMDVLKGMKGAALTHASEAVQLQAEFDKPCAAK